MLQRFAQTKPSLIIVARNSIFAAGLFGSCALIFAQIDDQKTFLEPTKQIPNSIIEMQEARIDLQKTNNRIDSLKLSIDSEVAMAKNNFNSAIATMDFQKKNMSLAEKVYNQTKKKYEIGTASQTDITAAQTDLKSAETNYINSLYEAIIARIDYLKATGKLD